MKILSTFSVFIKNSTRFVWKEIESYSEQIEQQGSEKEALSALKEEINVYEGTLTWEKYSQMKKKPEIVKGNVWFHDAPAEELEKIKLPREIYGNLSLGFTSIKLNFLLPDKVTGVLYFPRMDELEENSLQEFVRQHSLKKNKEGTGYIVPEKRRRILSEKREVNNKGTVYKWDLKIRDRLGEYENLGYFPETIEKNFTLINISREDLAPMLFPKNVLGTMRIDLLKDGQGITLPEKVEKGLYLEDLISAKGMIFPKEVGGRIELSSLKSGAGLDLSQTAIGMNLYLNDLVSVEDMKLPKSIGGKLWIQSLPENEVNKLKKEYDIRLSRSRGSYEYYGKKK